MICTEIRELIVDYIEGLLTEEQKFQFESHLKNCSLCKNEYQQINSINQRFKSEAQKIGVISIENQVLNQIICEQNKKLKQVERINRRLEIVRKIMKSRITKFTLAAVIVIAAGLGITLLNKSTSAAFANQVLAEAIKTVSAIDSIHIKAQMRTLPADNFSLIKLDFDFVPIELWKKVYPDGSVKWKIEKPGRLIVMDGNTTTLFIKPNFVSSFGPSSQIRGYDCDWFGKIADVKNLLESEYEYVTKNPKSESLLSHQTIEDRDKTILEIYIPAQGDYKNDYLKNSFLNDSDRTNIYYFDTETKNLEKFEIVVHSDQKDVLVFETIEINYAPEINDNIFIVELPANTVAFKEPQVLSDKYQNMKPKEMASAFFEACSNEDWDEFLKFWPMSAVDERLKTYLGGLDVISLGEPFQSGIYPGWFVPYEIKFKNGTTKKHNLAVRKDNSAGRYVFDGGL
ncbi:MAG: hypothetical protein A2Y10_10935 [Planctomycetes bacterium GWF2_41_51]|nr:MAG: hypothetical protein A2Y10_10935 [Planctomycetes bacterium GWF2_41_51]HBG28438.1 hypothetical protein [Phycisphaerales bacterium]